MKFPIAIEQGDSRHIWGVVVPDLPGCFSGSNQGIDQAIDNAKEAIEMWIETTLDMDQAVPQPSLISKLHKRKEYIGWIWAMVEIDPALMFDEVERVTISLPKRVLARLDSKAKKYGESRSGLIAHLALTIE